MRNSLIKITLLTLLSSVLLFKITQAQSQNTDTNPVNGFSKEKKAYTIGKVSISGGQYLDTTVLKTISGLKPGDIVRLPADEKIAKAIRVLWSQGILDDLSIDVVNMYADSVDLNIRITERPKLAYYSLNNVNRTQKTELKEKLDATFKNMNILSEAAKVEIKERIKMYFQDKGYANVDVLMREVKEAEKENTVGLQIHINPGKKVKINNISFIDNDVVTDLRLKSKMKDTKEKVRISLHPSYQTSVWGNEPVRFSEYLSQKSYFSPVRTLEYLDPYLRYKFFAASKFDRRKYEQDKVNVTNYYNSIGHRDAIIIADTIYSNPDEHINIDIRVKEGVKYYFGDIVWSGNTKYSDSFLTEVIGIKRGDVYNRDLLNSKLGQGGMDGSMDLGSLYSDRGYLSFYAQAEETSIVGDTINLRIRMYEGQETMIKRVIITGNDRTNDHVIRRELFTKPGNIFSRADIYTSVRQLAQLGYIDPQNINPDIKVNQNDNTVDVIYAIAEKPNDQFEAQIGYGAGIGFTGSLGITLNNISLKNFLNRREWKPVPMGDGQSIGARWQSNGIFYNSFNFNFHEPWLGGKKPIGLTFGLVYTKFSSGSYFDPTWTPNSQYIRNYGANVIISKRLKWPDNRFVGAIGLNYQNYFLKDYNGLFSGDEGFSDGTANNLNLILSLSRNSIDNPIFPKSGSNISLNIKITPPYSLLGPEKNYASMTNQEKYKWIEYHKVRFDVDWYQTVAGNLVFRANSKMGYLGYFNKELGNSPFERYYVGGDGMTGFNFFIGRDVIAHRGYEAYNENATIFNKHTFELRYPFSLNPNSTIFGLLFYEMANAWNSTQDYNPFRLNRSAGVGLRLRLPMFGLIGFDYGFGFDAYTPGVTKFGQAARLSFMLSREPD